MNKTKISISISKSTLDEVQAKVLTGFYRNKSHFIELATKKMLEEIQ